MKKFLSLPPVSLALEAVELYNRVGVSRSAAALAYFLTLTLFPLLSSCSQGHHILTLGMFCCFLFSLLQR